MRFAVILASLVLAGCATMQPGVQTRTTVFHRMSEVSLQDTFAVLPWRKELDGSLEFGQYADQMAAILRQRGFNVVKQGESARYAVFLDYGIDDGRTVSQSYSIPQWGVTGSSGSTTTGTVSQIGNTAYVRANTVSTPTYGITGYVQGTTNQTVFKRFVNIDVVDLTVKERMQRVLQLQLKSEGSCGALPSVMPSFMQAIAGSIGSPSGSTKNDEIKWSGNC